MTTLSAVEQACDEQVAGYDIDAVVIRLAHAIGTGQGMAHDIEPGDWTRYRISVAPRTPSTIRDPYASWVLFGTESDMRHGQWGHPERIAPAHAVTAALWRRLHREASELIG